MQKKNFILPNFFFDHSSNFSHSYIDPENGQFKKRNTIHHHRHHINATIGKIAVQTSLSLSLFGVGAMQSKPKQRAAKENIYNHQEVIMISLIAFHGRI